MPYSGILTRISQRPSVFSVKRKSGRKNGPPPRQRVGASASRALQAGYADLTRDGMHFHAAAAAAHMGSKGMLALLLDNDGNVGANFAGGCFRRKMQIRRGGDTQQHSARNRLQIPLAVCGGIALKQEPAGDHIRFQLIIRALVFTLSPGVSFLDT